MKQILQDLRRGATLVEDVPAPLCRPGCLRIATSVSLISSGTERTLVDFARGSLLSKAWREPDRTIQAWRKARTDGVLATVSAIRSRLDEPMAAGYCNVGRVLEVGAGIEGFQVGDRVISNGPHAGVVVVGKNLCAPAPDGVADKTAAFAVLGAVALQGVRLAAPTLGETFVVMGLGVVGLLGVQILRANGCQVLAIDPDPARAALARAFGAETADLSRGEDPLALAALTTRGRGVDGVLLTLSTRSREPLAQAAQMCRRRGRVVLVGVAGLELNRADFYEKELSFQVSCSYGPGRHDPSYEEGGRDYPFGLVRWTEQRNFEAVLDLMARGAIDVEPLISHRFHVEDAGRAYDLLASSAPSLGILIDYPPPDAETMAPIRALSVARPRAPSAGVAGFIGLGAHGGTTLARAFARAGAVLDTAVSASGAAAAVRGRKLGFAAAATDPAVVMTTPAIDMVCIATRHDSHAAYVVEAIRAGKNVFVEKPLCLTLDQLARIEAALAATGGVDAPPPRLMVGFNRRFAPMVVEAKALLSARPEAKAFVMTVNAGVIPPGHWTQDVEAGGGRLVGEACHYIDLLRHLAGCTVVGMDVSGVRRPGGPARTDVAAITLRFRDGSVGVINYFANGHRAYPKERLEVFCEGRMLVLDNFRTLKGHGWSGFSGMRALKPDKGHDACAAAFVKAVRTGAPSPIPLDEILEVSRLAIDAAEQAG